MLWHHICLADSRIPRIKCQVTAQVQSRAKPTNHPTNPLEHVFQGHKDALTGLAFSRDGSHLASACEDQSIRLFAVADLAGKGTAVRTREFNLVPRGIAFGQSSQLLTILHSERLSTILTNNIDNLSIPNSPGCIDYHHARHPWPKGKPAPDSICNRVPLPAKCLGRLILHRIPQQSRQIKRKTQSHSLFCADRPVQIQDRQ